MVTSIIEIAYPMEEESKRILATRIKRDYPFADSLFHFILRILFSFFIFIAIIT